MSLFLCSYLETWVRRSMIWWWIVCFQEVKPRVFALPLAFDLQILLRHARVEKPSIFCMKSTLKSLLCANKSNTSMLLFMCVRGVVDRACGRRGAGSLPSYQDLARVDGALCSARTSRSCQHKLKGPRTGPTVCHSRGNRSNKIPSTWRQGQLKRPQNRVFFVDMFGSVRYGSAVRLSGISIRK